MKKITLLILAIIIFYTLHAQDAGRGFKALEKSEFERAKDVFDKVKATSKENPAACFGLMVIYADKSSPYYNIVEAWSNGVIVEKNINSLTVDEKESITEYFTNTEVRKTSWPVNKKMLQAVGAVEANLIRYIREENNLELAKTIIEKFPDFRYYQNVVHIRNQLEFRKYEKQNTYQGYVEFIQKFPDAAQVGKAVKYRDKLAFDNVKAINTVEAYESYMKTYPASAELNTAVKLRNAAAFTLAKKQNTIDGFDKFILKYPNALEVSEAKSIQKQLLYEYAKRIKSLEAFDDFIRKYPEGSQYIDIFNLKSSDLGNKTTGSYDFGLNNIAWARSFDNKRFLESAGGICTNGQNQYIIAGNTLQLDSLNNDAWILKLDQDGKMIWNKILGGIYNDSVFSLNVNGNNEIIVLGYTWLGTDSSSKEAWVFKLDAEGRKIWNRSLGKWTVTSMVVNTNNEIILGGFVRDDSLQMKYKLLVMNNTGKKLWDRTYSSSGTFNDLLLDAEDNIVFTGSTWTGKMGSKGYLIWEKLYKLTDSLSCMTKTSDGGYIFAGLRYPDKRIMIRTGNVGQQVWIKEFNNPEGFEYRKILQLPDNRIVSYAVSEYYSNSLQLYNAEGVVLKVIQIPEGSVLHDFMVDNQGNMVFQLTSVDNILIIKTSGVGF